MADKYDTPLLGIGTIYLLSESSDRVVLLENLSKIRFYRNHQSHSSYTDHVVSTDINKTIHLDHSLEVLHVCGVRICGCLGDLASAERELLL